MSNEISRRGLLKTTAWAAPAVVVATTAPAYATSGVDPEPEVKCDPKGIRVARSKGKKPRWDYHLTTTGCGLVAAVWINGHMAAYSFQTRRWTVYNRPHSTKQVVDVVIVDFKGRKWAGGVTFL